MIRVQIRSCFSIGRPLRLLKETGEGPAWAEIREGATVEDLVRELDLLGPGVRLDDLVIFVFVNNEERTLDVQLRQGDVIDLHMPAMGG